MRIMIASIFLMSGTAFALDPPAITATAKAPNQINLTWADVADPGYGYQIEIQSSGDSRYANWTILARVPYWVTEANYTDPQDGTSGWGGACQYPVYGLRNNTTYYFRVCSYAGSSYSAYSGTASAMTTSPAAIRYVSLNGNDNNDGTSWATAWRHIYRAQAVGAGTLVLIDEGNYASDYLHVQNSGTYGNKIVFMAYPGKTVTITSGGTDQGVIYLNGRSYIVVDGINLNGANPVGQSDASIRLGGGSSRNAIVNCEVQLVNWPAIVESGTYNLFHAIRMHNCGTYTNQGEPDGICMNGSSSNYNVVQYGTFSRIGHDAVLMTNGASRNKVLNNVMDMYWGGGANCGHAGTQYNLIEGNVISNVGKELQTGSGNYKPGIQLSSPNNTVRRNIIRDGRDTSVDGSIGIEVSGIEGTNADGNKIYNNTLVHNGAFGLIAMGTQGTRNLVIANNIFYDMDTGHNSSSGISSPNAAVVLVDTYTGSVVHHNLILSRVNGSDSPSAVTCVLGYGNELSTSAANSNWPGTYYNNITSAPNFSDYANFDYHLNPASQAINAGQQIADSTWGTIGHRGTAPDIGAFEYSSGGSAGADTPPAAPKNLHIVVQ